MIKQYFIPTGIFSQVIEVDAAAGVGVAPATNGTYRAIAGVLADGTLTVATDTTAPTLSGVSVADTDTTATLSWSTNEGNGTAYWMVDTNATRTAAQVIAGGGAASGSRLVTASGGQTAFTATGLSASTAYFFHLVHQDAAGNNSTVSSTGFTTEAAGATTFTLTGTGPYFQDPANVPANTTRIEAVGRMTLASYPASSFVNVFTQESTSCDLQVVSTGGGTGANWRIAVKDGTNTTILSPTGAGSTGIAVPALGAPFNWALDVNQGAGTVSLTINGTSVFSASIVGDGLFQTAREICFFANTAGGGALPSGTVIEFAEAYFTTGGTRTLRKRVSGNAATVNADPWRQGTLAT